MKRNCSLFTLCSLLSALCAAPPARAATQWWQQPTICRMDTSKCYSSMGVGYDSGFWDAASGCWGMKLVCAEALNNPIGDEPVPMSKAAIANNTGISLDFDVGTLNGNCFGARRSGSGSNTTIVGGISVKVWCRGVLNNPDQITSTGEIKGGAQPTCSELAEDGWVAALNGKCWGRKYPVSEYHIECGSGELPTRIIALNKADFITGGGSAPANVPTTQAAANTLFDAMQAAAKAQRALHFN